MSLLILLQTASPITNTGGISAGWAIIAMGGLISILLSAAFRILNSTLTRLNDNLNDKIEKLDSRLAIIQEDFHKFVQYQMGENAKFEERTKDL